MCCYNDVLAIPTSSWLGPQDCGWYVPSDLSSALISVAASAFGGISSARFPDKSRAEAEDQRAARVYVSPTKGIERGITALAN